MLDSFISYGMPLTEDESRDTLVRYQATKSYAGLERVALMKIYSGYTLIGYSLPRVVTESECRAMKIDRSKIWYRLGSIFIDEPYRGNSVTTKVMRLFREIYPNVCWQCEVDNKASFKSAIKAGLVFSHLLWFNNEGDKWSFEEGPELPYPYKVLKTEL